MTLKITSTRRKKKHSVFNIDVNNQTQISYLELTHVITKPKM